MFKPQCKQLISVDGIELKPSSLHKSRSIVTVSSFAFSAIASRFSQLLKCDTDMVASYRVVPYLQRCYVSLVSTWLLKMLHKCCNTDVLGVLLIYPHSPSGTACSWDCAYISVKPLAAMLQHLNQCMYACTYVIYVYVRMYVCVYMGT